MPAAKAFFLMVGACGRLFLKEEAIVLRKSCRFKKKHCFKKVTMLRKKGFACGKTLFPELIFLRCARLIFLIMGIGQLLQHIQYGVIKA